MKLSLWQGLGIELEYAIVHQDTLDILPISDQLLFDLAGEWTTDAPLGNLSVSNELVLHQFEIKNDTPLNNLTPLLGEFAQSLTQLYPILEKREATLLPSAMHPWMNPAQETRLWPHEYSEVYQQYDKIFNCHTHGFSNVQSAHLNLSFANEEEFIRLHTALRYLMPILPALAASSPICEGKRSGYQDTRLQYYGENQKRIPSITGKIIPEAISSLAEYREKILQPIFQDIKPLDPEGLLQFEWLNSRGAIARFDRDAMELRIMDMQECPQMDLSLAAAVTAVLRSLVTEQNMSFESQLAFPQAYLENLLTDVIQKGVQALVENEAYLAGFGFSQAEHCHVQNLWTHLIKNLDIDSPWRESLELVLIQGTLATRILSHLKKEITQAKLREIYQGLAKCLRDNLPFQGAS